MYIEAEIEKQAALLTKDCTIMVSRPCTGNDGVLFLTESEKDKMKHLAVLNNASIAFFVPASGVGSRMFQSLNVFLQTGTTDNRVVDFFENIHLFPFYKLIPEDYLRFDTIQGKQKLIEFIVGESGLNYNETPKGLIPFHVYNNHVRNAFQEQLEQVNQMRDLGVKDIEFSVKEGIENSIMQELSVIENNMLISFSTQNESTNAYCFNFDGELIFNKGNILRKPAGHGALIENLNQIHANYVCIKNIDNIQRIDQSACSKDTWQILIGVLTAFEIELKQVEVGEKSLSDFNSKYQLGENLTIEELLNRPVRVCGMVPNQGAPGGGPFWVEYDGVVRKQIVERSQIKNIEALNDATHFNPVFMVISTRGINDQKFDLQKYVRKDESMRVEKFHEGEKIIYHELPGLWNGSMGDWNTVFVDIPAEVFTPVKEVNDLLNPDHQP